MAESGEQALLNRLDKMEGELDRLAGGLFALAADIQSFINGKERIIPVDRLTKMRRRLFAISKSQTQYPL